MVIRHWTFVGHWFLVIGIFLSCQPALADLRVLNSKHYTIHTDLDTSLAEDLARRMDAMYGEYEWRLAKFKVDFDIDKRFEVYLFQHKSDYDRLTGNRFPNTGGIFMAGARNLLAAFLETQGRDALRRTLQHEAFHQFAFTHIGRNLPVWLNEGMAQLFEEGIWTGRQFLLEQIPPRRVRQLKADFKARGLIDFKSFLAMSDEQWATNLANSADRGATQYNQAWAIVHFLVYSKNDYRTRLNSMLENLHKGDAKETAFEVAFSKNYRGFQDRFVEWSSELEPTAEATTIEYQQVLADMLTAFKKQGNAFNNINEFKDAVIGKSVRLRYSKGQVNWSSADDPRVYFSDLEGRTLASRQLYLEPQSSHPLPDLVRDVNGLKLRTIFYEQGNGIEHELIIEP